MSPKYTVTCNLRNCGNLWCVESVVEREVADKQMHRADLALTYALAMMSDWPTDWGRVNRAILTRWSESGLVWIKERAHRLLRETSGR